MFSHVRVLSGGLLFFLCFFREQGFAFKLKIEKDGRLFKHCNNSQGSPSSIWYTSDKRSVWVASESLEATDTPLKRILLTPKTDEEKILQNYFLTKEFPFLDVFLDETTSFTPLTPVKQERIGKNWKRVLQQVATWMLEHKYLETDPRIFKKFAKDAEERYFQRVNYRQFPIPVLRKLHPIVEDDCKKGLLECLKLVHEYAHAHMQHFNKYLNTNPNFYLKYHKAFRRLNLPDNAISRMALSDAKREFCIAEGDLGWTWFAGHGFAPFLSWNDLFEFRTTASYYLCNYTISEKRTYQDQIRRGLEQGAELVTPPPPGHPSSADQTYINCLFFQSSSTKGPVKVYHRPNMFYTLSTMDGFHCNKVGPCQIPIKGHAGRVWEDDFAFDDYSCALTAFCPDPCCGAFKSPLQDPLDIKQCKKPNSDFPCRDGGETDDCQLDVEKNSNFHDLIQNRINISCGCNEKEGKKWSSFLATCLDVDECQQENPCNPEREVCVNRLNGKKPLCVCGFGFYRDNATNNCVPDPSNLLQSLEELAGNFSQKTADVNASTPVPQISDEAAFQQALGNIEKFFGLKSRACQNLQHMSCTMVFGMMLLCGAFLSV